MKEPQFSRSLNGSEIAVIGMAGRFPGAKTPAQLWSNLREGVESVVFFDDEHLKAAGVSATALTDPDYVKARPVLENIELFDASFFGVNPREASVLDPQNRLFLECAVEAVESAGYDADTYEGAIGLCAGSGTSSYLINNLAANPQEISQIGAWLTLLSNAQGSLATRVAYKLNLKGPCYSVQTFCSTSLVAVHLARQSLLNFESDIVLAGGVAISVPQHVGYWFEKGGKVSPDGHCRAFDARANGTVFGNGLGIVVLKRLEDALADNDNIMAVIKGSAINNDGSLKASYAAPSVTGQAEVIVEALANAGVEPETVTCVEAHGTGTNLGDPVEMAALIQAFSTRETQKKGYCAIGSIKTNIGHLDAAAGVTGLIKMVMALQHKQIPASLHYEQPNPEIDFVNSPFYVNTRLKDWESTGGPRRAGVSSFGIGGTNAHVILEEAPEIAPSGESRSVQLLVLSARTNGALDQAAANLAAYLKEKPGVNLADVSYTLQAGRRVFEKRLALVCRGRADAIEALETSKGVITGEGKPTQRPIVFLFSGGGAQYMGMGWGLYQQEKVFRDEVDRCSALLKGELGLDLRGEIFPGERWGSGTGSLKQLWLLLPALFVVEYALAKLWNSWGIEPEAMIGHSLGEYVAACLAGVFTLEVGLKLVAARGKLMQEAPAGLMTSVELSGEEARKLLKEVGLEEVNVAAVNGPKATVLSGPTGLVMKLEKELENRGLNCQRLETSHAAHSGMMDEVVGQFVEKVKAVELRPPILPYISNVTGKWITKEEATDPVYWGKHLRQTVRFSEGLQEILKGGEKILVEVGPGRTLSSLAKMHLSRENGTVVVSSLRHPEEKRDDEECLLSALGRLWQSGVKVKWSGFYASENRRRVSLPTYPFERQKYWVDGKAQPAETRAVKNGGERLDVNEWFYTAHWNRFAPLAADNLGQQKLRWLIFENGNEFDQQLVQELAQAGQEMVTVRAGSRFERNNENYVIRAGVREDYEELIGDLRTEGWLPDRLVHLWSVVPSKSQEEGIERFRESQETGYYSLLYLAQALASRNVTQAFQLEVITSGAQEVDGCERIYPESATVLGLCKVIPQEYRNITCRTIDVVISKSKENLQRQAIQIAAELRTSPRDKVVAYRRQNRWVQTFMPVPPEEGLQKNGPAERLRANGVYLITGGLGKVGFEFGDHLARTVQAKLVLIGRSALPPREGWGTWLNTHEAAEATAEKIRKIEGLERMGAEVLVLSADVGDEGQMRLAWEKAEKRFGVVNGVIHAAWQGEKMPIQELKRSDCERQFKAKVQGLYVLAKVLEGRQLDFCYLTSSLAAVLGGLGFGAYAAANLFMDAFAQKQNQSSVFPWISVNWDWDFRKEAFFRSFSVRGGTGVVISTQDLQKQIDKWIKFEAEDSTVPIEKSSSALYRRGETAGAYLAPRNETERQMTQIWEGLLGVSGPGIHDNFFELGGHSLLATQVITRVRKVFAVELSLRSLFEAPTVAELSEQVEKLRRGGVEMATPEIRRVERNQPLPVSYSQEYVWLYSSYLQPNKANFTVPQVSPIAGPLQIRALERAIGEMIRRHEVLRTTFINSEAGVLQVVHDYQRWELPVVDLEGLEEPLREEELRRLTMEGARRVFDLMRGPLLRITLVRLGVERHTILHMSHHILTDGLSYQIWDRELRSLYDAFSRGEESPLAELPIQYADYAVWQRSRLQGEVLEEHLTYWRNQMAGMNLLQLPTDYPRLKKPTSGGVRQEIWIGPALVGELKKLNEQGGVTLFMVLLAGIKILISRYSGEEDISIGAQIVNRSRIEIEELIGYFTSPLIFRTSLKGDPTVAEFLERVKEMTLGAYAHQDLPWCIFLMIGFQDLLKRYTGSGSIKRELVKSIAPGSLGNMMIRLVKNVRLLKNTLVDLPGVVKALKNTPHGSGENKAFGSFFAGRSREEIDALIRLGMFLIELRRERVREIMEDPKVKELVDLVMEFSAAYGLRDSAYGKLMEEVLEKVQPGRTMRRNRAHVLLNFLPVADEEKSNLQENRLGPKNSAMHLEVGADLNFSIRENNLGLRVIAHYNQDLFKPETIARILEDLQQTLEELMRNPTKRISELNIGKGADANGRPLNSGTAQHLCRT
jgi:acyl transferase domain-containing protein